MPRACNTSIDHRFPAVEWLNRAVPLDSLLYRLQRPVVSKEHQPARMPAGAQCTMPNCAQSTWGTCKHHVAKSHMCCAQLSSMLHSSRWPLPSPSNFEGGRHHKAGSLLQAAVIMLASWPLSDYSTAGRKSSKATDMRSFQQCWRRGLRCQGNLTTSWMTSLDALPRCCSRNTSRVRILAASCSSRCGAADSTSAMSPACKVRHDIQVQVASGSGVFWKQIDSVIHRHTSSRRQPDVQPPAPPRIPSDIERCATAM